jgi:conjugative relaxase-like TrwC/TraI family protein
VRSRHLRKNDYWAEGEKEVEGIWAGEAARLLELEGAVRAKQFEALRMGRDPRTRLRLNTHTPTKRVAFFDVQISAPKDVSVLGVVAGDEQVRREFYAAAQVAVTELERWAVVRERRGKAHNTEAVRLTRNLVSALFLHDASRDLDSQLHVHAVIANVTWDSERWVWMALQPAEMMRASRYVRQAFYRELAGRMTALGGVLFRPELANKLPRAPGSRVSLVLHRYCRTCVLQDLEALFQDAARKC